jgi:hypothetical protein
MFLQQKTVIKVSLMDNPKFRSKALKIAVGISGNKIHSKVFTTIKFLFYSKISIYITTVPLLNKIDHMQK